MGPMTSMCLRESGHKVHAPGAHGGHPGEQCDRCRYSSPGNNSLGKNLAVTHTADSLYRSNRQPTEREGHLGEGVGAEDVPPTRVREVVRPNFWGIGGDPTRALQRISPDSVQSRVSANLPHRPCRLSRERSKVEMRWVLEAGASP